MMLFADALFGLPNWIDAIIRVVIVILAMTLVVIYLTYGERKVVARFQQRLGRPRPVRRASSRASPTRSSW